MFEDRRRRLDLWFRPPGGSGVAIELKYPTDRLGFVRDIARIEELVATGSRARRGWAVLLTNERALWSSPSAAWEATDDAAFRIHEGRVLSGTLAWAHEDRLDAKRRAGIAAPVHLRGVHPLRWRRYSRLPLGAKTKNAEFRCLAVPVEEPGAAGIPVA